MRFNIIVGRLWVCQGLLKVRLSGTFKNNREETEHGVS